MISAKLAFNIIYLAHVGRAEATAMRGFGEVMERENPKPALFINIGGVGVDL